MLFNRRKSLLKELGKPKNYERELLSINQKVISGSKVQALEASALSLRTIVSGRQEFARLLARAVSRGEYKLSPASIREVVIEGKKRELYHFSFPDRVVHGVVTRCLTSLVSSHLLEVVYSYQKGKSYFDALSSLTKYIRDHVKFTPEPRKRGLYVLRRDIHQYTESIPVTDGAPVWGMLKDILEKSGGDSGRSPIMWDLIHSIIRPEISLGDGITCSRIVGIPTGSPITSILYNLCASPIDAVIGNIEGGFYARYCDDFVFIHPDWKVAQRADQLIIDSLRSLGLRTNIEKGRTMYFNAAGKSTSNWPEAKGAQYITFLGYRIAFDGTISLRSERVRQILSDIRRRILRTAKSLEGVTQEIRGQRLCSMVNRLFNPVGRQFSMSLQILLNAVTDRRQLKEMDYRIALSLAECTSGVRGVKAFRHVSYKKLRQDWKLVSLCQLRNRR